MASKVRTLEKIIADELDTSAYPTKGKLIEAARVIRRREQSTRRRELAEEETERKQKRAEREAEREAKRLFKASVRNDRSNTPGNRRKMRNSGLYAECRSLFGGCRGTGYIKDSSGNRTLPHAKCRGTGMRKVPKSVQKRRKKRR